LLCLLAACGDNVDGDNLLGGDATIFDRSELAFTHPMPTLDADGLDSHNLGRGPFRFTWTPPQLGPLFNNTSCVGCHVNNGRGLPELDRGVFGSPALIRISVADGEPEVPGGPVPVPCFGLQLQDHATFDLPEVRVTLSYTEIEDFLGDGTVVMRRRPELAVVLPNGDPFPAGVMMSLREAPALIGVGLLEAIPEATILAREDPDDADGDGISGRANFAWDEELQAPRLGRFGRKATVPRVALQAAGAMVADMGLTNLIFPEADGMTRDVNDEQFKNIVFHVSTLGVPAAADRDEIAERGRIVFGEFGCVGCHVPDQRTGDHEIRQLANQSIHPYTDLLLHDMGEDLADNRPDFLATGNEWRTAALWGIGLAPIVQPGVGYLHDGRARTLTEAILWHGGEAIGRREAFRNASQSDRDALLAFLATL
jgi:CxxC motif-containing protein (DUF1111 family)